MTAKYEFKALRGDLKYLIPSVFAFLLLALNVGYYVEAEENSNDRRYFLKQDFTFQMEFISLYSHWAWSYDALTIEQKQELIHYCKYRWGIVTDLDHADELKACSARKM
ncbi:hypothetical protein AFK24_03180 [Pseudomonas syringae]|uniref:Uncharacterized protein n=1 Tax=Pseudomonas syringae TaxID=317 RepID=A0A1C7ZBQ7_PSESX|nr:hypothetical protein [Pseudomonas syringae]OCR26546.1 hypothetical protein AFK24_03180 [Pseudomonas syringae]